mgnify:FL=1
MAVTTPSRASQAYEEQEAPVNIRTLTKATTPAVTITNFFKPKTVVKMCEGGENITTKQGERGEENDSRDQVSACMKGITVEEVRVAEGSTKKQTASMENENVMIKSRYFKSQESKGSKSTQQTNGIDESRRCNDSLPSHLSSETSTKDNLKSKKRSGDTAVLGTNKRQKQSSILSSFGKGTERLNISGKRKEMVCPVCGVHFASDLKNADINKHLDGCLMNNVSR